MILTLQVLVWLPANTCWILKPNTARLVCRPLIRVLIMNIKWGWGLLIFPAVQIASYNNCPVISRYCSHYWEHLLSPGRWLLMIKVFLLILLNLVWRWCCQCDFWLKDLFFMYLTFMFFPLQFKKKSLFCSQRLVIFKFWTSWNLALATYIWYRCLLKSLVMGSA